MNEKDKQIRSYSAADIRDYLEGKLSPAQMHAMEKAAMDDPFLADAMEGMELNREEANATFGSATDDLKKRLAERIRPEEKNRVLPFILKWRAAASIILVAGAGISSYFILIRKPATKPASSLVREKDQLRDELSEEDHSAAPKVKTDTGSGTELFKIPKASADTVSVALNNKSIRRRVLSKEESPPTGKYDIAENGIKENRSSSAKVIPRAEPSSPAIAEQKEISALAPAAKDKPGSLPAPDAALQGKASGVAVRGVASFNDRQRPANFSPEKAKPDFYYIQGVVTDSNAVPVSNATVMLKHTGEIVTTDPNGMFRLRTDLLDSSQDIVISSVGYRPVSISINPSQTRDRLIRLSPVSNALSEVVVVGYGTKKKESIRGEEKPVSEPKRVSGQKAEPAPGWTAYNDYISKNKKIHSADSLLRGVEIVSFLLNKKGELSSFRIEKSVSPSHDAAVIRLIKEGPPWKLLEGKKYRFRVSVDFD